MRFNNFIICIISLYGILSSDLLQANPNELAELVRLGRASKGLQQNLDAAQLLAADKEREEDAARLLAAQKELEANTARVLAGQVIVERDSATALATQRTLERDTAFAERAALNLQTTQLEEELRELRALRSADLIPLRVEQISVSIQTDPLSRNSEELRIRKVLYPKGDRFEPAQEWDKESLSRRPEDSDPNDSERESVDTDYSRFSKETKGYVKVKPKDFTVGDLGELADLDPPAVRAMDSDSEEDSTNYDLFRKKQSAGSKIESPSRDLSSELSGESDFSADKRVPPIEVSALIKQLEDIGQKEAARGLSGVSSRLPVNSVRDS